MHVDRGGVKLVSLPQSLTHSVAFVSHLQNWTKEKSGFFYVIVELFFFFMASSKDICPLENFLPPLKFLFYILVG